MGLQSWSLLGVSHKEMLLSLRKSVGVFPITQSIRRSLEVRKISFSVIPSLHAPCHPSPLGSVQLLSRVWLFATPWIAARQASLSITISWSSLRLTSIESMMPSSHLILGRPLLLLPPIRPSIRVFSNESTLRMRWPKYWSLSFSLKLISIEIGRVVS